MAQTATVQNRVRVVGGGLTLFTFGGQPIAFCEQVQHNSPRPVSQFSAIQPMDEPYAVELLNAPAAGPGTLTLNLFELFGSGGFASKVWDRLGANVGTSGSQNPFGTFNGIYNTSSYLQNLTIGQKGSGNGGGYFLGAVDIVDIFIRQAQLDPSQLQIVKIIRPLSAGGQATPYTEEYNGCMIVDVVDGETDAVGTVEIIKQVTVAYRYVTRDGNPSQAFALRDGALPAFSTGVIQ